MSFESLVPSHLVTGNEYLNAQNAFMADAVAAGKKIQKVRKNMECRRKLELRMEERKLRREICEFEFEMRA